MTRLKKVQKTIRDVEKKKEVNKTIVKRLRKLGIGKHEVKIINAEQIKGKEHLIKLVLESVEDGIKVYDNKVGVLTNNPSFDKQMFNLNNYVNLSTKNKENTFSKDLDLKQYSRGMGAIGLPGDLSSMSRFVKVCFTKMNLEFTVCLIYYR